MNESLNESSPRFQPALCRVTVWMAIAAFIVPVGLAQEPAAVTRSDIEARIRSLEEDVTQSEDARAALKKVYAQALTYLEATEQANVERQRLESERLGAPRTAEALRLELDRPHEQERLPIQWSTPLAEVESALDLAQSELATLQAEAASLDMEQQRRSTRRPELPQLISSARQALREAESQRDAPQVEGVPESERTASSVLARTRVSALEAQLAALEEELRNYDALADVLTLRRRVQEKRISRAKTRVQAWMEEAEERRQRKTRFAEREAEVAARLVEEGAPSLRPELEWNRSLALRLSELALRVEQLGRLLTITTEAHEKIRAAQAAAIRREDAGGLSDAVGALLRKEKADLPGTREYERRAATRRDEMAALRLEKIQHEEELEALGEVASRLAPALAVEPEELVPSLRRSLDEAVETRRRYLEDLISDCDAVFVELAALEQEERALVATVRSFETFIDERILWIPSSAPIWEEEFSGLAALWSWFTDRSNWRSVGTALVEDTKEHPIRWISLVVAWLALFLPRRHVVRTLIDTGQASSRKNCVTMRPTWKALGASAVLIVCYPALLWILGWRLSAIVSATEFAKSVGIGLRSVAVVLLVLEALRVLYRPGGLAEAHFGWGENLGRSLRIPILLLLATALPLLAFSMFVDGQGHDPWKDSAGRVALAIALLAFAHFVFLRMADHRRRSKRWGRLWNLGQLFGVALPGGLALLALVGYYFTAVQLLDRVLLTIVMALFVALIHAVAARGLLVTRRRLAIEQAKKQRALRAEAAGGEAGPPVEEDPGIDLAVVDTQSRQMLFAIVGVLVAVGSWFIWSDVLPALNFLDQVSIWHYEEPGDATKPAREVPVTLAALLLAVAILGGTFLANRNLPSVLEVSVLQRLPMGPGERYAVKAVLRYVVLLIGLIWAFGTIGIGWSKVQWLAAAISVGLGFGLQEIFANFVSGLIILGERPVRVGDWVTVGEVTGKVTRIHMRATTLVDRDLREWFVPNREFITTRLSNWTLSDPTTRVVVPVGIAYGSDTEKASRILFEVARRTPDVVESPPPSVVFRGFGDSSLELQLRFFISGRDQYPAILDPVNTEIHKSLAAAGIEIAFPQRDLHIRSAEGLGPMLGSPGSGGPD